MSERIPQLHLNRAVVVMPAEGYDGRKTIRDIQDIHEPGSSLGKWLRRSLALTSMDLPAAADPARRDGFAATIHPQSQTESLLTVLDDPAHPRQAAGWAALQLYRQKKAGPLDAHISISDPRPATALKSTYGNSALTNGLPHRQTEASALSSVPLLDPELMFYPQLESEGTGTTVFFSNVRRKTIPDILQRLQTEYDLMHQDEPKFPSSYVVAGIVGAGSVEEFADAWDKAAQQPDPVVAARTLLMSDVFIQAD